jgi:hypothetical protein
MKPNRSVTITILAVLALFVGAFLTGDPAPAEAQDPALPIGRHDGPEGTVGADACGAYGWAVDPDNPDGDLQVQILADGNPVASVVADQLRGDLLDACPDGTCGFGVNLWGAISAGEAHTITAQALDPETQTWVDLSGTPKTLTCWGYPVGSHDGAGGTVAQDACYASGWAADPDDPERDLQVQVLADGYLILEVTADALREDISACAGGTCGFSAYLGEAISLDQEHQIIARAYDEETAAWMNLWATPKSLTCLSQALPTPSIWISTSNNYLRGNEFAPGATLSFTVFASEGDQVPFLELTRTTDNTGFAFIDGWEHPVDLVVGNYVVVSDGVSTRTLVLEDLTIDVFDPATDYVAGTTTAGEFVHVVIGNSANDGAAEMDVYADGAGAWSADFTGIFEIPWDMWGSADVFDDDGDRTVFHLGATPPPSPWLTALPEREYVESVDWPVDLSVHLEIDDPNTADVVPDYQDDTTTMVPEWETNKERGWAIFTLAGYDLKVGDRVVMTGGGVTIEHEVRNLAITGVDMEGDTVAGTADPGAVLQLWVHGEPPLDAIADVNGYWQANFTGVYNIDHGTSGRAWIIAEGGNATAVDWSAPEPPPTPWLLAFPGFDTVQGWDWPFGVGVHLQIEDPYTQVSPDFEADGATAPTPWGDPRSYVEFGFSGAYDLKPGDIVTLTDGSSPQTHVVRNLSITDVNTASDTITGSADPGANVVLWPHEFDQVATLQVAAGGDGVWVANFSGVFDLVAGTAGRAQAPDGFGNATATDWQAPSPRFTVFPEWEFFDGLEWPDGASVAITVDGKPECTVEKESWGFFFNGNFGEGCDVQAGDTVAFTDGVTAKSTIVTTLAVTWYDLTEDFLGGTASPDQEVHAWVHGIDPSFMITTPDDVGDWGVDFGDVDYDLAPGSAGRAEQVDPDGDATAVDWTIPIPAQIDIRPWSSQNLVWCQANWDLIPVAVLSVEDFDATAIDHDTVRFGRTGEEATVAMALGRPLRYSRDVNGDGLLDMVYVFRFGQTGFGCADIPSGQRSVRVESILSGMVGSVRIEGSDFLTLFRLLGH